MTRLMIALMIVLMLPSEVSGRQTGASLSYRLGGHDLVLNGYGTREVLWIDVYRAALYLPAPSSTPRRIIEYPEPKLILIEVLMDDIPDEMPSDWRPTLESNMRPASFARLVSAYATLAKGDVLAFGYTPEAGSEIYVNGDLVLREPGYALMRGLLAQWLGSDPVSPSLKDALTDPVYGRYTAEAEAAAAQ